MAELEGVKSGSRGSRRRLRGASLWLRLLDGLGLVSRALLVSASSSAVPSATSTSSLTITLLLFEGWLIWPVLGFVCPGSYTHTQTVENQSPLRVISAGDASHCSE